MGIPMAAAAAYFAMATELLGGIMIILGAGTRIAAAASVISMSGALFFVHLAAGFSASKDGYEYVLTLAAVAASLALTGASKFSIDALVTARRK